MTDLTAARLRPIAGLLFLLLLVLPLPFLPEYGGANSLTRMMLTAAIVDEGSSRIDRYQELTVDKAFHEGHYYSDKAPAMALMAVPAYAVGNAMARGAGAPLDMFGPKASEFDTQGTHLGIRSVLPLRELLVYRIMVLTSGGLLFALAGVAVFHMAVGLSGQVPAALLATITVFLGTPMLGWSVQFFGHAAAGASLVIAFALAARLAPDGSADNRLLAVISGAALSLAVSMEYTAAVPALMIAFYGLWKLSRFSWAEALRLLVLAFLAAVAAALPMLIYHTISFGSPFSVGYSSVIGFEGMQQGFLGITLPDPVVLLEIIFGFRRGILWLSPVLIFVPVGFWMAFRRRKWLPEMLLSLAVTLYYFLLNASYFYWDGGASTGPRHVTPALPFMIVPLLWLWTEAQGRLRQLLVGLTALSVFFSLACASTRMDVVGWYRFPLKDPILEKYFTEINTFSRWWGVGLHPALIGPVWFAFVMFVIWLLWRKVGRSALTQVG